MEPFAHGFASVVVDVDAPGLRQPFTYRVPGDMAERLAPGSCVVVPFGTREAIGWVISLHDDAPEHLADEAIKDIAACVTGDGASVPLPVLQTARWMAQNYLADLAQSVRCALPDAQTAHIVRKWQLASDWEARLTEISTPSHRQPL